MRALFMAIIEHPVTERAAWVEELCANEEVQVRSQVERLLRADQTDDGYLEEPLVRIKDSVPDTPGHLKATYAGPYRLLRPIGRGSLSVVYLAIRDDRSYRQRVAVKLIRPEIDDQTLLQRFLTERQILATLDHPNIARLYEGGSDQDGRPYLAMEYVDGAPITDYCDARGLGIEERLRLFLYVCAAVQYAHQSLLVHRDLKPGNILVGVDGVPKLLDFGIAKLLAPREGVEVGITQTGHRPMTPRYASPEQVLGEAITTASDVYSLGVLLFELLTGHHPYKVPSGTRSELEWAICEEDLPLPSVRVGQLESPIGEDVDHPNALKIARQRGCSVGELRRHLKGDLDTIVSKTLRKEPVRRYGSARQLAEDIRRHLDDLPIRARQDHLGYRLGKFVRRNREMLLAASLVGVVLLTLSFVIRRQAEVVETTRSRVAHLNDVLLDRFTASSRVALATNALVPRRALDSAVAEVAGRSRDDPMAFAEVLETMGQVYRQAGLSEDARWLFEESLELRRRASGDHASAVANSLHSLGRLLLESGELEAGEALVEQALKLRRQEGEGDSYAFAENLETAGLHQWRMGRLPQAETLLMESLEVRERICPDSTWMARGLSDLGALRLLQLQPRQAVLLHARAALIRSSLSPHHRDRPQTLQDSALFEFARGKPQEAGQLFGRAVAERQARTGRVHRSIADALVWQARALLPQGRSREAVALLREALAVRRELQLGEGPDHALVLKYLGRALSASGEPLAGETLLREVVELERRWLPEKHPDLAVTLHLLSDVLSERGDRQRAQVLAQQASQTLSGATGWAFGMDLESRISHAQLVLDLEGPLVAEADLRQVLGELRSRHPQGHWLIGRAQSLLGEAMLARGQPTEARLLLAKGFDTLAERLGLGAAPTRRAAMRLGLVRASR